MWFGITGVLVLFALLASSSKGKSMANKIDVNAPQVKTWELVVRPLAIIAGIPWQYAMAWLAAESGGNPCAIGEPGKKDARGEPLEQGLFQLYSTDRIKLGVPKGALRAYCAADGSGRMTRKMTAEEVRYAVETGLGLIKDCVKESTKALTAAGIHWPTNSRDFWSAVKLYHALPIIVTKGFASVAKSLGYPPASWAEFRAEYERINPRARYNPKAKKQDGYWRALNNAQLTGAFVPVDYKGIV